jgi:hypothetical protein
VSELLLLKFPILSKEDLRYLWEVGVRENEADIARHLVFDVGVEVLWVIDEEILEDLSHQSVLAHEDFSNTTHLFAGLIHLLRADVVDLHNEHLVIGVQQSL